MVKKYSIPVVINLVILKYIYIYVYICKFCTPRKLIKETKYTDVNVINSECEKLTFDCME